MFVGQPGQLGPVGDEDDLLALGQGPDAIGHLHQGLTADPGIDLVKEQSRKLLPGPQADHSQQETGQLPARGDAVQGLRVQAGIGQPQKPGPQLLDSGVDGQGSEIHQHPHVVRKTQVDQFLLEIPGQARGRLPSGRVQSLRGLPQDRGGQGFVLFQTFQLQSALIQKGQVLLDFRTQGDDGIQGTLQFALELLQVPQPLFHTFRIELLGLTRDRGPQVAQHLGQAVPEPPHLLGMNAEMLAGIAQTGQKPLQGGQGVLQTGLPKQKPLGLYRPLANPFSLPGTLAQPEKLLLFPGAGIHLADLGQLEFQEFTALQETGHAALDLVPAGQDALHPVAGRALLGQDPGIGQKGVEDLDMVLRGQQPLLPVLAGVQQEAGPQFGQAFLGAQIVVDEKAAAPRLGGELAAEEDLLPVQAEHGFHQGLFAARADQVRGDAIAEDEVQRTQYERLAGPGLAREHVQARTELQFHVVDEGKATDAQSFKHSSAAAWLSWMDGGSWDGKHHPVRTLHGLVAFRCGQGKWKAPFLAARREGQGCAEAAAAHAPA